MPGQVDARTFLVERDSAAFRALVAKTQKLGALEIVDGWADGGVQVGSPDFWSMLLFLEQFLWQGQAVADMFCGVVCSASSPAK